LGTIPKAESLAMTLPYLDDQATRQEASAAILALAASLLQGAQAATNAALAIDPLYRVTQVAATPELANRAKTMLKQALQAQGTKGPGDRHITKPALLKTARAADKIGQPFFPFCIDWHDAKKRSYKEQADMLKAL